MCNTIKYISILTLALFASVLNIYSQDAFLDKKFEIANNAVKRQGDQLMISFSVVVAPKSVNTDNFYSLVPILKTNAGAYTELPKIIVNGAHRQKVYNRAEDLHKGEELSNVYKIIKSDKHASQTVDYQVSVPFENWMRDADFQVKAEECGCNGEDKSIAYLDLGPIMSPPYMPSLAASKIVPQPDLNKIYEKNYSANIIFQLNKSVLLPGMWNNAEELAKIQQVMHDIKNDPLLTIKEATLVAFASPEGPLDNNARLSRERGQVVIDYMKSRVDLGVDATVKKGDPENWEGLIEAIKGDLTLKENEKSDIIAIINDENDVSVRKSKLISYAGGDPYRYMLATLYPPLRCTNVSIRSAVPNFTVEEGKKLIGTKPELLSLDEMYQIANTYPKGSAEYEKVFDIALKTYLKNPVAQANSSAIALENNNLDKASAILYAAESSPNPSPELCNNIGMLYMLKKDYTKAQKYFKKAQADGDLEAANNLQELQKVLDQKNSFGIVE